MVKTKINTHFHYGAINAIVGKFPRLVKQMRGVEFNLNVGKQVLSSGKVSLKIGSYCVES